MTWLAGRMRFIASSGRVTREQSVGTPAWGSSLDCLHVSQFAVELRLPHSTAQVLLVPHRLGPSGAGVSSPALGSNSALHPRIRSPRRAFIICVAAVHITHNRPTQGSSAISRDSGSAERIAWIGASVQSFSLGAAGQLHILTLFCGI